MIDTRNILEYTRGMTVLLVEDNPVVQLQTKLLLDTFFQTVDTASDGQEGLQRYRAHREEAGVYYDIVITDIGMPVCNGIEMAKQIYAINDEQPIIVISAYTDSEYLFELINLGISHFINKPLDAEQFARILFTTCKGISDRRKVSEYYRQIETLNSELTQKNLQLVDAMKIVDEQIIYSETDLKGVITDASLAFAAISGYTKAELIGKPHNVLRHPDMPKALFESMWKSIKQQQVWQGEIKNRTKRGDAYYVFSTIKPKYDEAGTHIGYISIRQDITQAKEIEAQKEQLVHQSRHAIMGEMISIIAHQWKQPLNHLSLELYNLYKQVKREPVDKEAARFHYENGEKILVNLSEIITMFKGFFKPSTSVAKVSVPHSVEAALLLLEPLLGKHKVEVQTTVDASSSTVTGAQNELSQVFVNIFKNSIDELAKGRIASPKIRVRIFNVENAVAIRICDNAGGVREENMKKLFEPYFSTKGKEGTGMGLYMVKLIIEDKISGNIALSNDDEGLCTTITIPLTL